MDDNPLQLSKAFEIIKAFDNPQENLIGTALAKRTTLSWGYTQKTILILSEHKFLIIKENNKRSKSISLTEKGKRVWYMIKEMEKVIV
jgi:predicted transcriptional regulator